MDGLEVPDVFAGLRLDRDDRVAVGVVAGAIATVVVGRRAADRDIDDAALDVDRRVERPHVGARAILPAARVVGRVLAPGLVPRLSWLRHGPELPQLRTGDDVEGARVAGRALRNLLRRRADDGDVAVDRRRAAVAHADGHGAIGAEAGSRLPGRGVDRHQAVAGHEQDARAVGCVTWPVADSARRCRRAAAATTAATATWAACSRTASRSPARRRSRRRAGRGRRCHGGRGRNRRCSGRRRRRRNREAPDLLPGIGVERHHAAAAEIHHAVDHQRHRRAAAGHRKRPRFLQRRDVARVDLGQR